MPNNILGLTRQQLAEFITNHESIRAFEQLVLMAGTITPDQIDFLFQLIQRMPPGGAGMSDAGSDDRPQIPGNDGRPGIDGQSIPGRDGDTSEDRIPVFASGANFGPAAVASITVRDGLVVDIS